MSENNFKKQKIVICGPFTENAGYSYLNRSLFYNLIKRDWDVGIENMRCNLEIEDKEKNFLFKYEAPVQYIHGKNLKVFMDIDCIKIFCWLPVSLVRAPKFKKRIIYTMMETKGVDQNFINLCNSSFDECWVPTSYYKNVFLENGLSMPAKVIPIGIDNFYDKKNIDRDYKLNYIKYSRNEKDPDIPSGFRFISVFRWSYRKGYDVLIKSYLKEFKRSDDVSLMIFSRHAKSTFDKKYYDAVNADIQNLYSEYSKEDSPPIYWCSECVPIEKMPNVYDGECFISCSRGEGQSLPSLEATKMGLPTILPRHTGFLDYVNDETSYPIDVDEWVICNDVPEWKIWITRNFVNQEFPKFGEKAIKQTREHMRNVYENYDEALKKKDKLLEVVNSKYNWDNIIDLVEDNLNQFILEDRLEKKVVI